jgi:hypothetical protein
MILTFVVCYRNFSIGDMALVFRYAKEIALTFVGKSPGPC